MAFLFKSKKNQQGTALPSATRNIHTSEGAPSGNAPVNGAKVDGSFSQTPTPSSSYNNSLNSAASPSSPDPVRPRQRAESESQVQRPPQPPNGMSPQQSPNSTLYPWSQRRLKFSSPQSTPFPRYGAAINAVASKEGDIYMMGGLIDGSTVKGDLWMIESSGGSLSCFQIATVSEGPGPRVGHASLLVGNAFIVFGGDTKINETDALDDTLYLLNTSSRQWSRAIPPGARPAGRYGHTLNIVGSKLYVFGGQVEGFFFNDLIAFDLNQLQNPANKWEVLVQNSHEGGPPEGRIPPARTNHTIVTQNDCLYLFGGTNGVKWFNDVWTYDPGTGMWTEIDCVGFIPTPREGHASALVGDVMYVFGGRTDEGVDLGDLSAFRITSRRWYSFQNMGPAPSPRSGHSMTAFGKQIIVMAGEPSSAPRDPNELSMAYILDTSKIRYPNDSGPVERSAAPVGRIAQAEKQGPSSGRTSREAQSATPDHQRRGPSRESLIQPPGNKPGEFGANPNLGPGSRLPRASIAQAPSGPPPPGQAPSPGPRANGPQPGMNPRSKTPTKIDRGYTGTVDVRVANAERGAESPVAKEILQETQSSGQRTPTQQAQRMSAKAMEAGEAAPLITTPGRQRSLRSQRQRGSMDSAEESVLGRQTSIDGSIESRDFRNSKTLGDEPRSPRLTPHQEALIKELEAAKARNAWYASELALARKGGYVPNASSSPAIDERASDSLNDEDRPLVEAFLAMRAELSKMQATVDRQASIASKRIAEVEHQRDVAVSEAAYSRARLAAHGGSQCGTPQPEVSREGEDGTERPTDMSRRLALALASQSELKTRLDVMTIELQQERQAKELAEDTNEATRKRLAELEMQSNSLETENLRAELHRAEASSREEALLRAEAEASLNQLTLDKEELLLQIEESSGRLKDFNSNFGSLKEAVAASAAKTAIIEKQLREERERREGLERKLLQLRAEHEEQTTELESVTRRLHDAEELAESHAKEAETHKMAFVSGLERATSTDLEASLRSRADQRVAALEAQIERSSTLAKANQAAADAAVEKLRRAEERIAGLEAYQEQASREGLQLRRQLQTAMKDSQTATAESRDLKTQLDAHQREAGALNIQHAALKDLLGERGISAADTRRSPRLESPGSRFGTPEQSRLRELEHQLSTSMKAHDDLKSTFESREQEADRAFREKLEQLENDYQSAVHYVKGTEKMLKRMKDELARYKIQNAKMQSELDVLQQTGGQSDNSEEWTVERTRLQETIDELESKSSSSIQNLQNQIAKLQDDLTAVGTEKAASMAEHSRIQKELLATAERTRSELDQLRQENVHLETRASDAEQKVNMLLEQVETSVGHYRRQSQHIQGPNGVSRSHSDASSHTAGGRPRADSSVSQESTSFPDNRGSMALDSLANELEALRSHWESTNRNYRLSSQMDLERTPTKDDSNGPAMMSDSLAEWRRRLDEDERTGANKPKTMPTGAANVI